MKRFCLILSLVFYSCLLLSGCDFFNSESKNSSNTTHGAHGEQGEPSQAARQTFAAKEGRTYAPKQSFSFAGLAGSKLELTVSGAKVYDDIDPSAFPSQRFTSERKEYTTGNALRSPYVFLTVEIMVKALKGSEVLQDGYYIDGLRLVDFNKKKENDSSINGDQEYVNPQYLNTEDGDLKLSEKEQDYYLIHLAEGKSGRMIVGYFIDKESIQSKELYLTAGLSVEDSLYVPLRSLL